MHYEIVSTIATQPNAGAAGTPLTGDSLTVKNGKGKIQMIAAWSSRQVAGFSQFTWPSGHDTTRGYRAGVSAAVGQLTLPVGQSPDLTAQELISNQIAGSNTVGDIEQDAMLIWYQDFPGIDMKSISASEVESKVECYTTIETSIAAVATGQYSEALITASSDLLRANRNYAILGMNSRTAAHNLTVRGPDFGNVRLGCPGNLRPELTNQWFMVLSRSHGKPLVPVINSGNRGSTYVGFSADENAATTLVTLYLALLK
jgi:hypothetical protein